MGAISLPQNILDKIDRMAKEIAEVRKKVGLGNATISRGGVTLQGGGSIAVKDGGSITVDAPDGTQLILNPADAVGPEFRLLPSSDPDNFSSIRGTLFGSEAEIIIDSAVGASGDVVTQFRASGDTMGMATYTTDLSASAGGAVAVTGDTFIGGMFGGVGTPDGGQVTASRTDFTAGLHSASASSWWYHYDTNGGTTTHIGRWENFLDDGAAQGLYTGESATGAAGDTSFSLTYGATRASSMVPIASLFDSSVHPANVTAFSTTGFTLSWTTASHAGYRVLFWCFRI